MIGIFLVLIPSFTNAQTLLQPVPNYQDRNVSDEDLRSCFSAFGFAGVDRCGDSITSEIAELRSPYRALTLTAGDTLRCVDGQTGGGLTGGGVRCTVTHPDGTAHTAQEEALADGSGYQSSFTDASGNTTTSEGASDLIDRGGEAIVDAATDAVESVASAAISAAAAFILTFANLLLGIAGTLFNWVIVKTVFGFSALIGNSPGLLLAWGILRDIGNMLLLFGFIFIGLATILGLQTYTAKKALPKLIIFAILMNFSLFAAEAIIDVSNGFSSMLYTQANTDSCFTVGETVNAGAGGQTQEECAVNYGIAGHIMQSTGLSSIFSADNDVDIGRAPDAVFLVGLALFATIGAVVLFAASIMLVIRAVTLTFLMVTAPLGFAGLAIPPLQDAAKKWWHQLLHQSFFAPILLLMIFISLKITDSFSDNTGSLAGALTRQDSSVMGIIMVFFLVIGFLIASLIAAKKFGAMGAGFAVKTAGTLTAGGIGFAGRNTVGRSANFFDNTIRSSKFGQTSLGRRAATVTSLGAKSSFDPRGTKAASALGKQVGDLGKPHKGGYKDAVDKKRDTYTKYGESLKQTEEAGQKENKLLDQKNLIENSKEQEVKVWKLQEEELGNVVKERQADAQAAKQARDQALALQTQKVAEASSAAATAPTGGLVAGSAQRRQLESVEAAERAALDTMLEEHRRLAEQEKESITVAQDELTGARQAHEENMKGFDAKIKEVNKEILKVDKNSSARMFASNIENPGRMSRFTGSHRARLAGAAKIRDNLKKTKLEKDLEAIKSAAEKGGREAKNELEKVEGMLEESKGGKKEGS